MLTERLAQHSPFPEGVKPAPLSLSLSQGESHE